MAETDPDDAADICRDPERIAAFAPYGILDTPREAEYDDLAQLAAQVCKAPIAVVNLVLADRQWFKAEVGLGVRETGLDASICRHLLLTPGLTVIPDTREDPRLAANPLVAGEPGLRFYAGHLLARPPPACRSAPCASWTTGRGRASTPSNASPSRRWRASSRASSSCAGPCASSGG